MRGLWERLKRRLAGSKRPRPRPRQGPGCRISPLASFGGDLSRISLGANVSVGDHALIHCHPSGGEVAIGDGVVVKQFVQVMTYPGGRITIGAGSSLNPFCVLYGHGGLTLGEKVRIAAHTVLIPANHRFDDPGQAITDQGLVAKGIRVDDDVWIGANCTILDGVAIGRGAVVGAGSVVTRDVAPGAVVAGAPARLLRMRGDRDGPTPDARDVPDARDASVDGSRASG